MVYGRLMAGKYDKSFMLRAACMTIRAKTVASVQEEIESALQRLFKSPLPPGLESLKYLAPPSGMSARVSLCKGGTQRQIRSTADASYWNPRNCEATIYYEESEADRSSASFSQSPDPMEELVRILDLAEREPRYRDFVGLKPFRDHYLVEHGTAWSEDLQTRQSAIGIAIEQGLVLRSSIPNPKDPTHPTTAIRLQREHPEVKRILRASLAERSIFKPAPIRGEALSSTILAGRR